MNVGVDVAAVKLKFEIKGSCEDTLYVFNDCRVLVRLAEGHTDSRGRVVLMNI